MDNGTLVVGSGQAGVQIAMSLRDAGYAEAITLVGDEPELPYQRPPVSKGLLDRSVTPESIVLRNTSFYADRGIALVRDERIVEVIRDHAAGHAISDRGREIPFRHLALTTGARVRPLRVPGADLDGVTYLRTLADAIKVADAMSVDVTGPADIVVVGGGFIGLEAAAVARKAGHRVTVVEAGARLMARAVSDEISSLYLRAHRARGVDILLDTGVQGIEGAGGRAEGVRLSDGRVVPADLVIVGIGVEPRTELAESMGLECAGGILVDQSSRTSDGVTVAAGDCVSMPTPIVGRDGRCRIESVNNAVEQARNAAKSLLGTPEPYRLTPWFWSNQGDLALQMVGDTDPQDRTVVLRGEPDSEALSVLFFRDQLLVGAQCVNRPVDFVGVRGILGKNMTVPISTATDLSVPLRKMATELTPEPVS